MCVQGQGWIVFPENKAPPAAMLPLRREDTCSQVLNAIFLPPTWCGWETGYCCIVFNKSFWLDNEAILERNVNIMWMKYLKPFQRITYPILIYMVDALVPLEQQPEPLRF